jgi:AraC-like DNA-binding protein
VTISARDVGPSVRASAIAFDAGFGDVACFNRAFRRRHGMTLSQLREAAQRPK